MDITIKQQRLHNIQRNIKLNISKTLRITQVLEQCQKLDRCVKTPK